MFIIFLIVDSYSKVIGREKVILGSEKELESNVIPASSLPIQSVAQPET